MIGVPASPEATRESPPQSQLTMSKSQRRSSASIQLTEWSIFPMRPSSPVVKIEQEMSQVRGPLEVTSIARNEIHLSRHDLLEIFETEGSISSESILTMGFRDLRFDA